MRNLFQNKHTNQFIPTYTHANKGTNKQHYFKFIAFIILNVQSIAESVQSLLTKQKFNIMWNTYNISQFLIILEKHYRTNAYITLVEVRFVFSKPFTWTLTVYTHTLKVHTAFSYYHCHCLFLSLPHSRYRSMARALKAHTAFSRFHRHCLFPNLPRSR
jgi:hypothetical protein